MEDPANMVAAYVQNYAVPHLGGTRHGNRRCQP